MWQNLSLRGRINLLLALLLALGLAVNIGRQVAEAGPRVQAEDQSVIRLAREFIEMIVADLNEALDPDARLNQIARDLSRLRHVSITLRDAGGHPLTPPGPMPTRTRARRRPGSSPWFIPSRPRSACRSRFRASPARY